LESDAKEKRVGLYRRNEVRRLINYLLKGTGVLSPDRDPKAGDYVFAGVPGLSFDLSALLKELAANGILEEYQVASVPSCPKSGDANLYVDYRCPFCKNQDLEKGTIIEHYDCGHTDLETKFKSGNDLLCPKCSRTLKSLGTDYRRAENINHCMSCNRYFGAPIVQLTCRSCGHIFLPEEAQMKPVFGYRIVEKLRIELLAYCALEAPITALLKDLGYETTAPWVEKGFSGTDYVFDIFAQNGQTEMVVDITSEASDVGPESVATFFAKIYDSKPRRAILIAIPRLAQEAQRLSELYKLEVVGGESVEDLLRRFKELLERPEPGISDLEGVLNEPPVLSPEVSLADLRQKMSSLIKESE
jgi:hypothetical protein